MATRPIGSASGIVAITPDDETVLPKAIMGFMVGVAGDVSILCEDMSEGIVPGCLVGVQYSFSCLRINATGTTADNIIGLL